MRRTAAAVALATLAVSFAAGATAQSANAEPATVAKYPRAGASTHFSGYAFDACSAPTLAAMTAWRASPYRAVGVYAGGENRTCAQPNLTASWVSSVTAMGWKLMPIYVGRQAPCTQRTTATKITPSGAAQQGTAAATDAINSVAALGMTPGSAIYFDMENYDIDSATCRKAVRTFVSSWTKQLHRRGYLAGVYGNIGSLAADLTGSYNARIYARPDVFWLARWDNVVSLSGWMNVPETYWGTYQRAKQYVGDHVETYGGVGITVDSNYLNAPVATVARAYTVVGTTHSRTEPRVSGRARSNLSNGTPVAVLCQTSGGSRKGTKVWDKLSDGSYVSDHYVNTPSKKGFSAAVPRCYYPYQVTAPESVTVRSGATFSARALGVLRAGGLAWVTCQKPGTKVGKTKVWNRIGGGGYVTDHYVANSSNRTYSSPAPRC